MAKDHISPSQLSEAADCLRKWGYKSIEGIQPEAAASAQFGTDTHLYLERYYRTFGAELPDVNQKPGLAAMAGLAIIPQPRPLSPKWPGPEFKFEFMLGAVRYKGTIDLMYVDEEDENCAVILDHKTSSDPQRWGKTSEDLASDYQRVIYSVAALRHFDTDKSRARWVYYRSRPPYEAFEVPFGPESADATLIRFEKIHATSVELVKLRAKYRASDLPKNEASCEKYGGCPFKARCFGEPSPTVRERLNGASSMANPLLEQMRNGGGAKPEAPDHAPAPPKPSGGGLLGMFANLAGAAAATPPKQPPPRPEEIANGDVATRIATAAEQRQTMPLEVTPKPVQQVPVVTDVGRMSAMSAEVISQLQERLENRTLSAAELISLLSVLMG